MLVRTDPVPTARHLASVVVLVVECLAACGESSAGVALRLARTRVLIVGIDVPCGDEHGGNHRADDEAEAESGADQAEGGGGLDPAGQEAALLRRGVFSDIDGGAAVFAAEGEALHKAGLTFAYHNHDFEFQLTDQQIPYDVLLAQTDPSYVKMELDLFWTIKAKRDPLAYFANHPGRFPLWHVKDMDQQGHFADVGKGTIDFKAIFAKAEVAGLAHAFIEHDATKDPVATISQGFTTLKSLRS